MNSTSGKIERPLERIIQQITNKLIEHYQPEQIVLFGSLASGTPHADSDIDLLIVKQTEAFPLARRVHVRQLVSDPQRRIPFSPLVLTPAELEKRLALGDPFYQEIIMQGKVLYARN
jgi:predicted nucleotidyltransferase